MKVENLCNIQSRSISFSATDFHHFNPGT